MSKQSENDWPIILFMKIRVGKPPKRLVVMTFFPFEALQNLGRSRTKLVDKEKTFTSTGVNSLFLNHSVY
jgi:hypothetical protein